MRMRRHNHNDLHTAACCVLLAALVIASTVLGAEPQSWSVRFPVVPPQPLSLKPSSSQTSAPVPQTLVAANTLVAQAQTAPAQPALAHTQAKAEPPTPAPKQSTATVSEPAPAQEPPLSFVEAIQMALTTSPQFKATQLDIEIVKLDEKDSWYRLFPKLNMNVSYDRPMGSYKSGLKANSYLNIGLNSGAYDPIAAYIGHDASKVAFDLAEIMHALAIQSFMETVGTSFIKLNSQQKYIECRKELLELSLKLGEYAAQRADKGSLSPLDKRLVDLKGTVARMELEHNTKLRMQEILRLKRLLGIGEALKVEFDVHDSLPQVVGKEASLTMAGFAQVEQRNLSFKAMKLKEKLVTYKVRLAQAEHLPRFNIGVRTPDPTATKDVDTPPYYLTFSATMPLWSWGETLRNTERQELGVQKIAAEHKLKVNEARETWDSAGLSIGLLREQVVIVSTTRELRELEAKRKDIGQQAGNVPYETLIEAKREAVNARMAEIKAQEEYDLARLKIRTQSGDLFNEHMRIRHARMD